MDRVSKRRLRLEYRVPYIVSPTWVKKTGAYGNGLGGVLFDLPLPCPTPAEFEQFLTRSSDPPGALTVGDGVNGLPTELLGNIFQLVVDTATLRRDRCRL